MTVLSGMRATGKLHIGNFVTLENWVEIQNKSDKNFFFVADWHALTSHYDTPEIIQPSTFDIIRHYVAVGLDPKKSVLFVQSAIKEHAELYLIFSMIASVSRLERIPTYKEQISNISNKDLTNLGFLGYPVLQAADILIYKGDRVPVGEDQIYHLEFTREIARKFNMKYKEIFPEPQPIISKVSKLPGTDGRKMSKSYGNVINIETNEKELKEKILPMMTDPARIRRTDPGNPEKCPVWDYHKAFTKSQDEKDWVWNGCTTAGIGCVDCKKLLIKNMKERLEPVWDKLASTSVEDAIEIAEDGNEKARKVASQTMQEVREALHLRW
ncbi:tryptophanyl-tRNA synthase [Petrotoga miotherma DSM 10691]|uniref:Tryptophan--tRNA ligase n=1 Tax=Petrotoga miotherma DSM 10691 TaxID=1434326 RepID=A0A2K1PDX9_9BACT|nr:tryptophan--tRNA ligase [Petrotoga miotherma]PNS01000.1 tryptophanyl-tRNA synthase [Petrotoga miotherma DSM 10691]